MAHRLLLLITENLILGHIYGPKFTQFRCLINNKFVQRRQMKLLLPSFTLLDHSEPKHIWVVVMTRHHKRKLSSPWHPPYCTVHYHSNTGVMIRHWWFDLVIHSAWYLFVFVFHLKKKKKNINHSLILTILSEAARLPFSLFFQVVLPFCSQMSRRLVKNLKFMTK